MIPKFIHYCWFGHNPLPKSAQKCIDSWRKFLPDYEIKEWNEDNFDVNVISYTKEAYEAKKYAFVSDYARFKILYENGGIYFDTDVKVIKPFDEITTRGAFMGREAGAYLKNIISHYQGEGLAVAPGLGLGVNPAHPLYKEFLDLYDNLSFKNKDGSLNTKTIVSYTSEILVKHGLGDENNKPQNIEGIWIYPAEFFCPMDHTHGCQVTITPNTVSIHQYDSSWTDHTTFRYKIHCLKKTMIRLFGSKFVYFIESMIKFHKLSSN